MKRSIAISGLCLLYIIVTAGSVYAAGTSFTDAAQNPNSGVYNSDFSAGTAVFDFNNDGFDDIVVNNYYSPNRLYMSNGDGTFTDVGAAAGVSEGPHTLGIATSDLDASGFTDFLVFAEDRNPGFLYMNNGDGTFNDAYIEDFSIGNGYDGYAAAFADVDRDGLLDVFYAGRLFKNNGNMQFDVINSSCGLDNLSFVAHAAFGDIDNDYDPDLFIARQGGPAALFENDGTGHFTEITSNIEGSPYGLCGSFGDIDNDGDLDLFVSYSNRMYVNDGNGYFSYHPDANTYSRYTRGSVLADFDNDGDPDLILANEDGSSTYHENDGNGVFTDVTAEVGMDNHQAKAGGLAVGDFDRDGDLDFYIAKTDHLINPCFFNNLNNDNFVEITPRGTVSNFSGIGSKVCVYENGHLGDPQYQISMAELTSTSGFHAGTNGRVHLGTGPIDQFDLRVVFPSGIHVDTTGIFPGARLVIYESGDIPNHLYVSPGSVSFTQNVGDGPVDFSLAITDAAGEGVSWTAATDYDWINIQTISGTTPSTFSATIDPAGMGLGIHHGTVTIEADGVINSPVIVSVSITITNYFLENRASEIGLDDYDFTLGAAFFDYDVDGFDDIFVNNMNGVCRLYNSDGGWFTDEAPTAGVTDAYHNLGVFGGDLNRDDLPDILSFTEDKQVGFTYLNTGYGTFVDAEVNQFSTALGYDGYAANAADIDNDGDLDVFYGARLYRNDGNMVYTDITEQAGLNNIRFVCRALFGDIDGDNDMDLVINRQNRKVTLLFRNDGTGHFEDISGNSSMGFFPTALGTSFGDVDNDGDLDMYTGAGYSDPNCLFLNDGSGYFVNATVESGTSCNNYTRGTEFIDIDNDGDLDLAVANENRSSQMFVNDGTGHFSDITDECGINDGLAKAGPVVAGDYDADGDLDLYIGRTDNICNSFFENKTDNGSFITVRPVGIVSNRTGIGAKCYLYPAGQLGNPDAQIAFREYNISNGFSGSSANYVHFGTGPGDLFDVRVVFPSGVVVDQPGVSPGSRLTITESGEVPDYLVLIPSGFNFEFTEGDPSQQAEMQIKNSIGNSIGWTAEVDQSWCQLSAVLGTTDETIVITVDPSGIGPGEHEAVITVTAPDAVNSPRTATVRMTVASNQPVLALSTESLHFEAEHGGFNPWAQDFSILNSGPGTLDWTLQTSGEEWLSAFPKSGTAPSEVSVSCAITGMEPGLHTATITVTSPGALNSPAELTVYFEVLPGDVPESDTVRVASMSAQPGQEIVVPVYLHNINELAAFSIPLQFDPDVFTCDSVGFAGTRVDYINILEYSIDTAQGKVLFGMVVVFEDNLPPGGGEIGRLHLKVNPDAEDQVATIDTAFFPPAGDFLLFDPASEAILPEFVKGNIFVAVNMYGDADGSGDVNIGDGVYLVNYIFHGQRPPIPTESGDANLDTDVNVGDVVFIVDYVFFGGSAPGYAKPVATEEPVYYTTEKTAAEEGQQVKFIMDSPVPLGGIQVEVYDPAGFVTIAEATPGRLVSGMDVYYGNDGQTHRLGLLDLEGGGVIEAGNDDVLILDCQGFDVINVKSVRAFDRYGNEIPVRQGMREQSEVMPQFYSLGQNYPNPFNPSTTIKYSIVNPGHVSLKIYNVLGQTVTELVDTYQNSGQYSIIWDGTDRAGDKVASGVYFYQLKSDEFTRSRKMTLIK